jgi:transposase
MISYEVFCRLRRLHDERGLTASQIAAELHLDLKTVRRWVDQPTYQPRRGRPRASKLDAFKAQVRALLERHPYTAQQIFQRLRTEGYAGGYTILRDYVRLVRPVRSRWKICWAV